MADEALAQAQAEAVTQQARADALALQLAAVQSELSAVRGEFSSALELRDASIEKLFAMFTKAVGKDGIKVEWPFIGLDRPLEGGGGLGAQQAQYEFAVNVIEAGVLRVRRFFITTQVDDPDEEGD